MTDNSGLLGEGVQGAGKRCIFQAQSNAGRCESLPDGNTVEDGASLLAWIAKKGRRQCFDGFLPGRGKSLGRRLAFLAVRVAQLTHPQRDLFRCCRLAAWSGQNDNSPHLRG